MSRKAKIVLAITFMIACLVLAFSVIYISQLLRQRLTTSYEIASLLTRQLADAANNAVPDLTSTRVATPVIPKNYASPLLSICRQTQT